MTSFYGKIPIEYPKSFKLIEDNINIILFNLIKLNSDILCNPKDKVRDVLEMMKKINRSLFNKDDNEEYFYPLSNVSEFNLASLIINLNSYVFSDDLNNESLSIIISFFKLLFAIIYERYQEFHKKNCEIEEERLFINSLLSNYYLLFGMLKHQCSFDFILCIPFHLQVKLNFDEKENSYQNILNRKVSIYKIFKLLQTNVSKSALLKITWIKLIYYCFYIILQDKLNDNNYVLYNYKKSKLNYSLIREVVLLNFEPKEQEKEEKIEKTKLSYDEISEFFFSST